VQRAAFYDGSGDAISTDGKKKLRSVRAAPNAVTGPDGKPLTTATINYLVPEAP